MRFSSVHRGVIAAPILDKVLAQSDDPDVCYAEWVAVRRSGQLIDVGCRRRSETAGQMLGSGE